MIRASSERLSTSPQNGGGLRSTLSTASLASSGLFTGTLTSRRSGRSYTLSPPPKSSSHGRHASPRRFSSRHVPAAAEDLAANPKALTPQVVSRFDGLMKHLKRNTERQDFEKQVLASPPEVLVPDEYDELLRAEFCRRCSFGERLNTELMHSGKWVKMLRDLGLVRTTAEDKRKKGPCLSSPAEADIIFRRALCDSDYGGKRLTYDYFCKALCLVAANVYPQFGWEDAMGELLALIAEYAETNPQSPSDEQVDWSLDPNVLLQLDFFKPALHDLFRSFARRQLPGPTDARIGMGTTRLQERSIWKHTQDTLFASRNSTAILGGCHDRFDSSDMTSSPSMQAASPVDLPHEDDPASLLPAVQECIEQEPSESAVPWRPPMQSAEADAGGGYAEAPASPSRGDRISPPGAGYPQGKPLLPGGALGATEAASSSQSPTVTPSKSPRSPGVLAWAQNKGWRIGQGNSTMSSGSRLGTWQPVDPYTYANGSPIIKNRKSFLSLEQMFAMCKELKIVPDLLNRQAVVKIFKRVQCAGSASSHGGSNFGFLSQEAFVDAMGQIAIEAYNQEPYCDEYPQAHEKIHAFLMDKLPGHSRLMRDRFLYGCSGRGPPVQPGFLRA
eukprot:TRINITY_DN6126_c0_g1_i1.p1 TRINITY_DN6126_c0_g1~~TRINITY_DN6126_c0_g1_i1.p1  ORF type:complete len:615 (+),score=90.74 TRINITY_DN6126_c0_g1_i1:67-1911(+)